MALRLKEYRATEMAKITEVASPRLHRSKRSGEAWKDLFEIRLLHERIKKIYVRRPLVNLTIVFVAEILDCRPSGSVWNQSQRSQLARLHRNTLERCTSKH